jgi:hypothetical protein
MMTETNMAYVERGAIDAVLQAVRLLSEAGDTRGALRELEHFVAALKDKVLVPLEVEVLKESGACDGFPWLVKSRPERYQLVY